MKSHSTQRRCEAGRPAAATWNLSRTSSLPSTFIFVCLVEWMSPTCRGDGRLPSSHQTTLIFLFLKIFFASGNEWVLNAIGMEGFLQASKPRWFLFASGNEWVENAMGTVGLLQTSKPRYFFFCASGNEWVLHAVGMEGFLQASKPSYFFPPRWMNKMPWEWKVSGVQPV